MASFDTKAALLHALVDGESYGLELVDRVRTMTNGTMVLMQGRVYPALRELEADGFATSVNRPPLPERGGRPRRYYKLTEAGHRAAREQARAMYGLLRSALAQ